MRIARFSAYRGERDDRKKKATRYVLLICLKHVLINLILNSLYTAVLARFAAHIACAHVKDTCEPVLKQQRYAVSLLSLNML